MLVLIPVLWVMLALRPVAATDDCVEGTQLRKDATSSSMPMTDKPIKIPPKKV